jgi:glycosyltransferase involved in cell wall biosynthesis
MIHLYSGYTLQNWDFTTPFTTGIGGSETSHIEMAKYLFRNENYKIINYAPIEKEKFSATYGHWQNFEKCSWENAGIFINYRDNIVIDKYPDKENQKLWFIAQDVDYEFTPERLKKIDRYITLCSTHSQYTLRKYPELAGKIYQSSNGVRAEYIEDLWAKQYQRNPNQILYASSPDRGLRCLLQNWFRIIEAHPEAELKICYGFENTDKIINLMGGKDWRVDYKKELENLFNQKGVSWLGRIPQDKLYEEWFKTNVWFYPTDFPETSCITCMDAQACGAMPVTTDLWALRDNILSSGERFSGLPQENYLLKTFMLNRVIENLKNPKTESWRYQNLGKPAMEKYNWKNIADQWLVWLEQDLKCVA